MNMDTVVVYKDEYDRLNNDEWALRNELAEIKGTIRALANNIDDHPEFVAKQLKELVDKFK